MFESSVCRHAERAGGDRDRDHARDQHRQQHCVLLWDRGVEDRSQQERGHHAEGRREEDQGENGCEAPPVGLEEAQQAAVVQLLPAGLAQQRPLRWLPGRQASVASRSSTPTKARRSAAVSGARSSLLGVLGGPPRPLEALPAIRGQLDEVPAPVLRVTGPHDEAVGLEGVEQGDEVAGVDPQRPAEVLLGERPGVAHVMEHGELVGAHPELLERMPDPVARHPCQAHGQESTRRCRLQGRFCSSWRSVSSR